MRLELAKHPDFSIVTTGHSLGGSIALLAAVALQQLFAERYIKSATWTSTNSFIMQPGQNVFLRSTENRRKTALHILESRWLVRSQNHIFAEYVNGLFGTKAYRGQRLLLCKYYVWQLSSCSWQRWVGIDLFTDDFLTHFIPAFRRLYQLRWDITIMVSFYTKYALLL